MDTRKHIADNLEQGAEDMVASILTTPEDKNKLAQHRDEIAAILRKVEAAYKAPTQGWLSPTAWIKWMARARAEELSTATSSVAEITPIDPTLGIGILETITKLLQTGGIASTSANTLLLTELIAKTNKYVPINEEGNLTPDLKRLRELFLKKAHEELDNYKKYQAILDAPSVKCREEDNVPKLSEDKKAINEKLNRLYAHRLEPEKRPVQTSHQHMTKKLKNANGEFVNQRHALVAAYIESRFGKTLLTKPEPPHEPSHNTEPNEHFKAAQRELEKTLKMRF